jgi:uncharacterized membrane protein
MPEFVIQGFELLIQLLEICGAILLVTGFVVATWIWGRQVRQDGRHVALTNYRQALGRSVLIGLEVLVIATIIKTIILTHSYEDLVLLAGMIIIRTVIGWTIALEIDGKWPWQKPKTNPS